VNAQLVDSHTYTLANANSGKVLNVDKSSMENGGNVHKWDNENPSSHVPYSWVDAWAMAHLSAATWCSAEQFNRWSVGSQKYSVDASKVRLIQNPLTQATVGVGRMTNPDGCFVAVRGTHDGVQDFLDGVFVMVGFNRPSCPDCRGHAGFLASYESVRLEVFAALELFGCKGRKLYLTGHSLGAAMLHFLLYDAIEANYEILHVTAMESPRPGNHAFATALQSAIARKANFDAYRVTYSTDLVVHVPPFALVDYSCCSYTHALPEIYYGTGANSDDYTDCGLDDSMDDGLGKCANSHLPWKFDLSHHCWFGNMNPCSCGSGVDSANESSTNLIV